MQIFSERELNIFAAMAPPTYGDLGKQARDVFGKVGFIHPTI
jgi:hypothetical protein